MTIQPGDERRIRTELENGNSVALVGGATYTLSSDEAIFFRGQNVELDGNGALLLLDESFNNYVYRSSAVHGDVHSGAAAPKPNAVAIYVREGSSQVTI